MNVTLNLTTEFEEIPNELAHMLKLVEKELSETSGKTYNVSNSLRMGDFDGEATMESLHNVRLKMARVDARMEDCMSILSGYLHYLENPPDELPEEEDEEG
jgi:hypothetical protein